MNAKPLLKIVSNISVCLLKFNVREFYVPSVSEKSQLYIYFFFFFSFLRENRASVAISGKLNPIKKNWSKFHMFTIKELALESIKLVKLNG